MVDTSVTANEADDDYTLAVTAQNGTVTKNPNTPYYDAGSTVELTAAPNSGYTFSGWSGTPRAREPDDRDDEREQGGDGELHAQQRGGVTDVATVNVPEGATATFQVRLSAQPTGAVTVAVGRTAGDTDLGVSGGASLSFTTGLGELPDGDAGGGRG